MPTYSYSCPACAARTTAFRKIDQRDDCPGCECGQPTERRITATMVAVFTPYRAVAFDKESGKRPLIRNRDEHEAFLRRNGYEEVGNDKSMAPLPAEEVAYRRKQALKEQAAEPFRAEFDFDPETHDATLTTGETA